MVTICTRNVNLIEITTLSLFNTSPLYRCMTTQLSWYVQNSNNCSNNQGKVTVPFGWNQSGILVKCELHEKTGWCIGPHRLFSYGSETATYLYNIHWKRPGYIWSKRLHKVHIVYTRQYENMTAQFQFYLLYQVRLVTGGALVLVSQR